MGVISGLVVRVSTYAVTKNNLKKAIAFQERVFFEPFMLIIALVYLSTFIVASLFSNPYFLQNVIHLMIALSFAVLSTWIGHAFITRVRAQKERRDFKSDPKFEMKRHRFEFEKLKELFHLYVWLGVTAFIGVVFTLSYQSFIKTPSEITTKVLYSAGLTSSFLLTALLLGGYWLGIARAGRLGDVSLAIDVYNDNSYYSSTLDLLSRNKG